MRNDRELVGGFVLMLVFLLVSCGPSQQPTPPEAEPATALPAQALSSPPASASSPVPSEGEAGPSQDGRPLAARVNGYPVYLDVYQQQVAQTEKALIEQGLILDGEEGQAQLSQIRQNVLNGLIEQALIEQAAASEGIFVTDDQLEATVQESIALGQGQETFDQWLAENGLTMDDFRSIQRSQLIASKMIEHVTVSVPTTTEQVHARHIRTSDQASTQRLLDELGSGANFAALAQQASEDESTSANGGDLGWFPRDVPLMPAVVVETAFALNPGEISGVVESEKGYHIVKVEAREANRPLTPEMLLFARQRAFENWLGEEWSDAVIERYIDL